MPYWSQDTKCALAALSEYEAALFKKAVTSNAPEKAREQTANDHGGLTQLFAAHK